MIKKNLIYIISLSNSKKKTIEQKEKQKIKKQMGAKRKGNK